MFKPRFSNVRALMNHAAWVAYHIVVVALSAATALALPAIASRVVAYWSRTESEKALLVSTEIAVATVLIVFLNYLYRSVQDKRLARMAEGAGLVAFLTSRRLPDQKRIRRLKGWQGIGRNVMVIGSTGYGTFVDAEGDLSGVLDKCLEAKLLLVNPYSEAASIRVQAIGHPDFTLARFRSEVTESIEILKKLKATGKTVRLKLYSDPPLVKLVILGDYLWLKHYHTDLDVQTRPEYVFRHNHEDHGLYTLFYEYFLHRWESTEIPEYDFDTDELVYRGSNGVEIRRERFGRERLLDSLATSGSPDDPYRHGLLLTGQDAVMVDYRRGHKGGHPSHACVRPVVAWFASLNAILTRPQGLEPLSASLG
jgi:hypothetical protein